MTGGEEGYLELFIFYEDFLGLGPVQLMQSWLFWETVLWVKTCDELGVEKLL